MFIISGRYFFLSTLFFRSWKIKLRTTLPCIEITSCRIGWADAWAVRLRKENETQMHDY